MTLPRWARLGAQYLVVVAAAAMVNFALPRLAPGDPVDYLAPPESGPVDPAWRQSVLERFDLDGSWLQQLGSYLGNLIRGDLGVSVIDGRPVAEVVAGRLGWSLLLVGAAVAASTVAGVALGFAAVTLTLVGVASVFVVARSAMISELGEDYVFMARAKGLSDRSVRAHARRNAMIPVSTAALLGFSTLVGAATVVETVFSYPGLGSLAFAAVRARDYPVLQAVFLLLSLVAVLANLVADLLYPLFDPRVRRLGAR